MLFLPASKERTDDARSLIFAAYHDQAANVSVLLGAGFDIEQLDPGMLTQGGQGGRPPWPLDCIGFPPTPF